MLHLLQDKNNNSRGFTLIELLIAMAITGILLAALTSFFMEQSKSYATQNEIVEMQSNARAAMEFVTRTLRGIRIANPMPVINGEGTDNTDIRFSAYCEEHGFVRINTHRFTRFDSPTDGPNTFAYGKRNNTGASLPTPAHDPLALNITRFNLQRLTQAGANAGTWANTERIRVIIGAETENILPATGKKGKIELTSYVDLRIKN